MNLTIGILNVLNTNVVVHDKKKILRFKLDIFLKIRLFLSWALSKWGFRSLLCAYRLEYQVKLKSDDTAYTRTWRSQAEHATLELRLSTKFNIYKREEEELIKSGSHQADRHELAPAPSLLHLGKSIPVV